MNSIRSKLTNASNKTPHETEKNDNRILADLENMVRHRLTSNNPIGTLKLLSSNSEWQLTYITVTYM